MLLSIMNSAWFMEPSSANHWANLAQKFFASGAAPSMGLPSADKRGLYTRFLDLGSVFRVNELNVIDTNGAIQIFRMNAPVAKYDYCGSPGSQTWIQLLKAANEDPSISAIILWIDSPGGQADGTEALSDAIKNSLKPVLTYSDGYLCSAVYWFASSSVEIYVDGANNGWNATIGSIGTMNMWQDNAGQLAQQGIVQHIVFADASTDKWGDYFKANSGDYTRIKAKLNGLNDTFLTAVTNNRAGKLSDKVNVLTGETYNANDALKYGLIDAIGTFDQVVKRAAQLAKKQAKSLNMTHTASAFDATLIAAKATEFQVVDGGFLLTESQLNNINASIDQQATVISATAAQLKTLQTTTATVEQVQTLQTELKTANEQVATLTTDLSTTKQELATEKAKPGASFINTKGENDQFEATDADLDCLAHNRTADEL